MAAQLIECVPNISEGRDDTIIQAVADVIRKADGVKLLDVDPGRATNRTVITFVGAPDRVIDAAFQLIKKAAELIDMSQHSGEHPRQGATDVCPLIPISGISMEETVKYAKLLGERVGAELGIPIYLYESAATAPHRKNLATVRAGEYEGLAQKFQKEGLAPDFGSTEFNEIVKVAGATAIGARDFLIAYNVNLNTTSVRRANTVAFDIREKGRIKRSGSAINSPPVKDQDGNTVREAGLLKGVKAIGWFIEEYGFAQISMNITDVKQTSLHKAFETCRERATVHGLRVTGSELVGLVPLQVMLDAGRHFLKQQRRSVGVSEAELVRIAIMSMGLDQLTEFDPKKKIIEYMLLDDAQTPLLNMTLTEFANETASESPAPGGGSISAYVGALGASLSTMVANLSSHRRVWDDRWEEFGEQAAEGQEVKDELLRLVDADTDAFNNIMAAIRMPKSSQAEKAARQAALNNATEQAINIPLHVMKTSMRVFDLAQRMASSGNPASVSDAGVGALCARAAVRGAFMNVQINCADYDNKGFVDAAISQGSEMVKRADQLESEISALVEKVINS